MQVTLWDSMVLSQKYFLRKKGLTPFLVEVSGTIQCNNNITMGRVYIVGSIHRRF